MIFTLIVIVYSVELSSQFECLPNGAPIPGFPSGDPSSPASDKRFTSNTRSYSSKSSSFHAEPSLRLRSRSPPAVNRTSPTRIPFPNVFGYRMDQLEFIRLIPYENPQRHFEFRKYSFPVEEPIEFLQEPHKYRRIPTQEQIVLSTSDGDVFAILEGADILGGIYTYDISLHAKVRVKINMKNGKVMPLTTDEIKVTPVGRHRQILYGYRVEHLNHNDGSLAPHERQLGTRTSSSSRQIALPTRLPSSDGSGCELDQLPFIRLIPKKNPDQIFELQRYTFPADKLILVLDKEKHYGPIPIQELIVLTTNSRDVFSILESSIALAGIYKYNPCNRNRMRVKINMLSGTITQLTKHEMRQVPVGTFRTISKNFKIEHVSHNPPRLTS